MGELPPTADSVLLGIIGFMKAAFGLRFAAGFFALAAGFFAALFFIGDFLAADFFAAGFFAAFLDFLAAMGESSNLMVTLGFIPSRPVARQREDAQGEKALSTIFTRRSTISRSGRRHRATPRPRRTIDGRVYHSPQTHAGEAFAHAPCRRS